MTKDIQDKLSTMWSGGIELGCTAEEAAKALEDYYNSLPQPVKELYKQEYEKAIATCKKWYTLLYVDNDIEDDISDLQWMCSRLIHP